MQDKVRLSDHEWRRILSPERYRITRQQETELPCSGSYHDFQGVGVYRCACCGYELFSSREKSLQPQKWPTFRAPITEERVTTAPRIDHFLVRTAVKCGKCDAHLGYVFPDRKPPSWARYVINSAALTFLADWRQGLGPSEEPSRGAGDRGSVAVGSSAG